jgi:hypothetical protein
MENLTTTTSEVAPAPVSPIPQPNHSSAKEFFLWLGFVVAFYSSVTALISLIFSYIDIAYPDVLNGSSYYGGYGDSIPYTMATLLVMAPAAAALMYVIRLVIQHDSSRQVLWVRRWAILLTIFIAGAVILGDFITLFTTYLNGEIAVRFVLKILIVFLLSFAIGLHFLADNMGYWASNQRKANSVSVAALLLCILTIVSGFVLLGSPATIRLQHLDQQKVTDLQNLESNIYMYAENKTTLPVKLTDIEDNNYSYGLHFVDAQTNKPYEYRVRSSTVYELCAVFNKQTSTIAYSEDTNNPIGWHDAGRSCFTLTTQDRNGTLPVKVIEPPVKAKI